MGCVLGQLTIIGVHRLLRSASFPFSFILFYSALSICSVPLCSMRVFASTGSLIPYEFPHTIELSEDLSKSCYHGYNGSYLHLVPLKLSEAWRHGGCIRTSRLPLYGFLLFFHWSPDADLPSMCTGALRVVVAKMPATLRGYFWFSFCIGRFNVCFM